MTKKMCYFCFVFLLTSCASFLFGKNQPVQEIALKQNRDVESILVYRKGLESLLNYVKNKRNVFGNPGRDTEVLTGPVKNEVQAVWASFCDYYLAIDSIESYHRKKLILQNNPDSSLSFNICRASMLMQYRYAVELVEELEKNRLLEPVLNDSVPEIKMPAGTYSAFKQRYLSVFKATEFSAFICLSQTFDKPDSVELQVAIKDDTDFIWKTGKGKGEILTLKNAFDILVEAGNKTWFPFQKGISSLAGHTKVYRINENLITREQVEQFNPELAPGDIILERREWYVTNIGIPGFWTHAALYVGSSEERKKYFGNSISAFLKENGASDFEDLLRKKEKSAHEASKVPDEEGKVPRVLEALGKGVVFTSIEYTSSCDSIAVLRPGLSRENIARAILKAFHYSGRPYDFDFNMATDSALFCSELVYKVYEGYQDKGLVFPFTDIAGNKIVTGNDIGELFKNIYNNEGKQLSLVLFYDGVEMEKKAVRRNEDEFIKSLDRPKWHVFIQ